MTEAAQPLHFREYDTRVAAYAVIIDERGMLLSWFNGNGHPDRAAWSLPGGGIDYDEQIEEGLIREIYEETGYHAELTGLLTTDSFAPSLDHRHDGERPFKSVRIVYTARITGGTLGTVEVGGSTDKAEWHPVAGIPTLAPHVRLVDIALNAWKARVAGKPMA